jgi:hypothetical protein
VAEVEEVKGMTGVENMTGMEVMKNDIRRNRGCLEDVNRLSIYVWSPYPPYDEGHE